MVERLLKRSKSRRRVPLPLLLFGIVGLVVLQFRQQDSLRSLQHYLSDDDNNFLEDNITTTYDPIDCKTMRGTSGRWIQDWDYANRTHYVVPQTYTDWHVAEHHFTPTQDEPFRLSTSWMWEDDSDCPVEVLESKADFCDVLWDLDIRRFLIVGDSLTIEFGISFLSLLKSPPNRKFMGLFRPFNIKCPARAQQPERKENATTTSATPHPAFDITVMIVRRSPIQDLQAMCSTAKNTTHSNWDANPRNFVANNDHKTAIIFNTGSWLNDGLQQYKEGFHCMVDWIDSLRTSKNNNSGILAFFRPTNRQNFDCLPQKGVNETHQSPHSSLEEYYQVTQNATRNESLSVVGQSMGGTLYATQQGVKFGEMVYHVEDNNAYSQAFLVERQRTYDGDNNKSTVPIYWLNTYNSTAMRRDGHIGNGDCLHYSLPGPTDWWVHFFYSLLLDLRQEQQSSQENAILTS